MKKIIRHIVDSNGTGALLRGGVNILPFFGLALLVNASTTGMVFGVIFILLGLLTWTFKD